MQKKKPKYIAASGEQQVGTSPPGILPKSSFSLLSVLVGLGFDVYK